MTDCRYAGGANRREIQPNWPAATHPPALGEMDVQVCCAALDRPDEEIRLFVEWLSPEEKARGERAATELLRRRFVARRGVARGLLGRVLGRPPQEVHILHGEEGKPSVEDESELSFSLSHSGPLALMALARCRRVGVDVEDRRPRKNIEGLVKRSFSRDEIGAFLALPEAVRTEAFYRGWTRKEAVAKALGKGIASSFQRFSVDLGPEERSSLVCMDLPGESADAWALLDLEPASGYWGALAMEDARDLNPTLWSLPLPPDPGATMFGAWRV